MRKIAVAAFAATLVMGLGHALAQNAPAGPGGAQPCPANQPNCVGVQGGAGAQTPAGGTAVQGGATVQQPAQADKTPAGQNQKNADQPCPPNQPNCQPGQAAKGGVDTSKGTASQDQKGNGGIDKTQTGSTQGGGSGKQDRNAGGGMNVKIDITADQRERVHKIIVDARPPAIQVNFNVAIGVAVPRTVHLAACPAQIIEIAPGLAVIGNSCEFFVLPDGRIVFVDARTYQVVYILV
jgi:hypothetical protein